MWKILTLLVCFTLLHTIVAFASPKKGYVAQNPRNDNFILRGGSRVISEDGLPFEEGVSLKMSLQTNEQVPQQQQNNGFLGCLHNIAEKYNKMLITHPYMTKMISSAVVAGLGDILMQFFEHYKAGATVWTLNKRRLAVFSTVAGVYIAPVINMWFNALARMPMPAHYTKRQRSLMMTLLDQTFGAVFVTGGYFFAFELINSFFPPNHFPGLSSILQAGWNANKKSLWGTLVINWYMWPVINFVNFEYVPLQYRVLFSNFAAIFWNMFLSSITNGK